MDWPGASNTGPVLFAEINYGGRVTDDKDMRLIKAILSSFFTPHVMDPGKYPFSSSKIYYSPENLGLEDLRNYISSLPLDFIIVHQRVSPGIRTISESHGRGTNEENI